MAVMAALADTLAEQDERRHASSYFNVTIYRPMEVKSLPRTEESAAKKRRGWSTLDPEALFFQISGDPKECT